MDGDGFDIGLERTEIAHECCNPDEQQRAQKRHDDEGLIAHLGDKFSFDDKGKMLMA
jgi:hypothetical protein